MASIFFSHDNILYFSSVTVRDDRSTTVVVGSWELGCMGSSTSSLSIYSLTHSLTQSSSLGGMVFAPVFRDLSILLSLVPLVELGTVAAQVHRILMIAGSVG